MPVRWRLHVLEEKLVRETGERFVLKVFDLYALDMDEQHVAIDAVMSRLSEFPVVLVGDEVVCVGDIDADAIVAAAARWSKVSGLTATKEQTMSAVVYLCEECGVTFEAEGGCCCQPAAITCPKCGSAKAQKQPEAPKPAGGCGCGDGCC